MKTDRELTKGYELRRKELEGNPTRQISLDVAYAMCVKHNKRINKIRKMVVGLILVVIALLFITN